MLKKKGMVNVLKISSLSSDVTESASDIFATKKNHICIS
jgi:hypothetical protein